MDHFDVYVAGFEVSEDRAVRGLVQVFGMSKPAALNFVRSLPRMGKRGQPAEAAERYVRSLRAIGAVVQCTVSRPTSLPPSSAPEASRAAHQVTSLPPPRRSTLSSTGPSSAELAAAMPNIPKAPRLPEDIMPIAQSDAPAELPEWFMSDPTQENRRTTASVPAPSSSRPARDHDRHYALSMQGERVSEAPPLDANVPRSSSRWPAGAEHTAKVGSQLSAPPPGTPFRIVSTPARTPTLGALRIVIMIVLGACIAVGVAHQRGVFETQATRTEREFRGEGLEVGEYREVNEFLNSKGARFDGIERTRLRELIDALAESSARQVWAVGIEPHGDMKIASSLVIELPNDPTARRTIFFQHARTAVSRKLPIDEGQRFLKLDF